MNALLQTELDRIENEKRLAYNRKLFTKNELDDNLWRGFLIGISTGLLLMYLICHFG